MATNENDPFEVLSRSWVLMGSGLLIATLGRNRLGPIVQYYLREEDAELAKENLERHGCGPVSLARPANPWEAMREAGNCGAPAFESAPANGKAAPDFIFGTRVEEGIGELPTVLLVADDSHRALTRSRQCTMETGNVIPWVRFDFFDASSRELVGDKPF